MSKNFLKLSVKAALSVVIISAFTVPLARSLVYAEGTSQLNDAQSLNTSTVLYADILNSGETLNISTCSNASINIWNTNGTPNNTGDDTQVVTNAAFTANLNCGSALPSPITNPYRYTPASVGTYRFTISGGTVDRYDFTVTANNSTNPVPATSNGRIWSYAWKFSTGSFDAAHATDADMFILVPGANNGEDFVWKLDLNKFSGNAYELDANSLGLDAPYSGLSATQAVSSVTPEFKIYLGYPAIAGAVNTSNPVISNPLFIDNANEDNIFSPGFTPGVQDTGSFKFSSNVMNANYAITIDTNQDGVYGTGDRLLLGKANLGQNTVAWDGNYPNGSPVPVGVYHAQVQIRLGEYHFIAQDVETSGGTSNGGSTWNNGLTIYRATGPNTTENTTVYWDDLTELSSFDYPSSNVPTGVTSGSLADANGDGRADGFHTWGTFGSGGVGNNNNIDTYVYGPSDVKNVTIAVASSESGDNDGVDSAVETGANNNGDGNGDGIADFLQDKVASLPNTIGGGYNTVQSSACTNLSSVGISSEASLSPQDNTYDYPLGLANFHVNCASAGSSTTVTVFYDQQYDTSGWTARAFVNGSYVTIPGATFGTATLGSTTVTKLTYTVTDGGVLDGDGLANSSITSVAGPGAIPQVVDNDGVDSSVEAASPNSGDGNNDGIPDSQQSTVTGLSDPVTGKYAVLQTNGCTGNSGVSVNPASGGAPDALYQYPAGLMAFTVTCAAPGSTATVTQYYYGNFDATKFVARKYNPTTKQYATVPGAVLSSVTIGGQAALKIVYQVTDGSSLDQDGQANGVIVDPVGPAILATAAAAAPNTGLAPSSAWPALGAITIASVMAFRSIRRWQAARSSEL